MPIDKDSIGEELNAIAADLLRGPNPTIPKEEVDRTSYAFLLAKEMLIENIKNREFTDMTGGKIGRIVHNR
tara:strand:- start:308 stop:520 length:213 start_codon:yes stop_codon:yes gene_type:complete